MVVLKKKLTGLKVLRVLIRHELNEEKMKFILND